MAKTSSKKAENAQRLRYIRVLERFCSSITNYLFKAEEPTKEAFDRKVDNNLKYLHRAQSVPLYKGEFSDLEALAESIATYRQSDEPIDVIKESVLYQNNQIEKSMNRRRYKKDKHTTEKFKDWE